MMTRSLIAFIVLAQLAATIAGGQRSTPRSSIRGANPVTGLSRQSAGARRTGSIAGRVITDSGQPLANAWVFVRRLSTPSNSRQLAADEEGRFHADDLMPGPYVVSASISGFVPASDSADRKYYRIGDTADIQMTKGGVITGTVTTQTGEPVIAARVFAARVRDSQGRPVRSPGGAAGWTDDRGIYRVYGLQSGSYLVSINGGQFFIPGYAYEGDVPVYHPSSTRDSAKEVGVQTGQEIAGIDIRYRSVPGHAISGKFTGSTGPDEAGNSNTAVLIDFASSSFFAAANNPYRENSRSFAFYGVPDGDYNLIGQSYSGPGNASAPRRVTMKGADVTGIELAMAPLGSIAGRLKLETLKEVEVSPDCRDKRSAILEETAVLIRRDEKNEKERIWDVLYPGNEGAPNEKGEFELTRLIAGHYYLQPRLPGDGWFVRAVSLPGATPASLPHDIARDGISVIAGKKVNGLVITAAEGAAALRGNVIPASEGGSIPANLRVHLAPAERESADDAVRFAETLVNNDGSFSLTNLAPGRYYIMARVVSEDEWMDRTPRPLAWDSAARARLRQEMESANALVDLRQCQRLADYVLKYATPSGPKPPRSKRARQD